MKYGINFLGQDIIVGTYSGFPNSRTIITENGTGFNVLKYFIDNYGDLDGSRVEICKDTSDNNIFAIGYQHTDYYGLRTFVKWADQNTGLIPDNDTIPTNAPWNNWAMLGTQNPTYGGVDPDNITTDDIFLNSFTFYTQDTGLYPYYNGANYTTYTADQARGSAPVNLILNDNGLHNSDGTQLVNYSEATPYYFDDINLGFTNWIDSNNILEPSYSIGTWGTGSDNIYNPLEIIGALNKDHFDEDPSGPGGGIFGTDYGYGGQDFLPTGPIKLNAIDTGFLTLFSPTKTQLWDLHDYLWSSDIDSNLKKLYADPMEAIIMFGIMPVDLSDIREASTSTVLIGNISTGIGMYKLSNQYIEVDMGTITVPENWTNSLDYAGDIRIDLFLPFCGYVPMKVDDVMDGTVNVKYNIDCLTGDCAIQVTCKKTFKSGNYRGAMMYQHHGNCLINVPVTSASYANYYKNAIMGTVSTIASALSGNVGGAISGLASTVMGSMEGPDLQRSGNYSGSMCALSHRTPCLIITRGIQQWPKNYNKYIGYPSYITYQLKTLKTEGFTKVDAIIENTISGATEEEMAQIERLLKEGVIL